MGQILIATILIGVKIESSKYKDRNSLVGLIKADNLTFDFKIARIIPLG